MAADPPNLPYARDEASTSQPSSAYPAYPGEAYEHAAILESIDDAVSSSDDELLESSAALQYWTAKRHRGRKGKERADDDYHNSWRLRSRLKTFNGGLFICLNIGVDPPDIVKTNPCAKLECWIDPTSLPSSKATEAIGRNLQQQFETLNPKIKYRPHLDPSIEETKKQCVSMRKNAREERVLFYYNGHGVPKPTPSGEIWVFNKNYTQYIPVSLYDLQEWLGSPCIYVWECSGAGNIINNFSKAAERKDNEMRQQHSVLHNSTDLPGSSYADAIHLAACTASQILPMSPDLPADLFTSCLTSPIETSLRHFVLQDPLKRNISTSGQDPRSQITVDMVMKIPGDLKDRRTPLGELSWIFTAVTDTIAWTSFPREIFDRLFRQDLLVAALFRNFLLAQRIMTTYHCTPMSVPELSSTHNHPLWHSWDLAVDACLAQLPERLEAEKQQADNKMVSIPPYRPSLFFAQHLQAFEVWLRYGGVGHSRLINRKAELAVHRNPPEQLPIVLQVLLSQAHRLRALILLSRFVDLGPWAVHLSLAIGIFPYVTKLLASPAIELKPVLIFIWARILAVDKSCQMDLLRDQGYNYFAQVLAPEVPTGPPLAIPNANEHRAMCAFILSMLCRGFRAGQQACLSIDIMGACIVRLREPDWLLKQWCLLCIAQIWADNDDAKSVFLLSQHQNEVVLALRSPAVEVRAAALYAFGTLLGASSAALESNDKSGGGGLGAQLRIAEETQMEHEVGLAYVCAVSVKEDASPMVRKELMVVISCVVREWRGYFTAAAWAYQEQEAMLFGSSVDQADERDLVAEALSIWTADEDTFEAHQLNLQTLEHCKFLYEILLEFSVDPHIEVALMASTVVDYITALLLDSAFARVPGSTVQEVLRKHRRPALASRQPSHSASEAGSLTGHGRPPLSRANTQHSDGQAPIKRNSSVANALKGLASIAGLVSSEPVHESRVSPVHTPVTETPPSPSLASAYRSPYPAAGHQRVLPDSAPGSDRMGRSGTSGVMDPSIRARTGLSSMTRADHSPVSSGAVLEALTEEDMERLRIRRLKGTQAGGDVDGRFTNNGLARPQDLGLGMVAKEVKDDVLPLRSGFYDWATEYFREPQMQGADADEPGSKTYNRQAWRHSRNEGMVVRNKMSEEYAALHAWGEDAGTLHTDQWTTQMALHAYDPLMAVVNEADEITLWDWKTKHKLNRFSNKNVPGTSVSSIHFINEMASSLLLTATTDGSIRIWRDYETPGETELASTFRGVGEMWPVGHTAGVLTAWGQQKGHLLVGGDMRVVRLWDATVERHLRDISTQAGSNLTAICTDEPDGNVFLAGFGDGVVRLFDKRVHDAGQVVLRTWRKHHIWIQSVSLQRGGQRELVTGSMNGEVRIWDVRAPDKPLYETVAQKHGLMALAVHPGAPVLASSSAPTQHSTTQRIVLQGFSVPENPKTLSTIHIPLAQTNVGSPRPASFLPSSASLVFHPVEMVLAAGAYDHTGNIQLFRCPIPDKSGAGGTVQTWENVNGHR